MGEFEELPEPRHAVVRQALQGVGIDRRYASYDEVPIALRHWLASAFLIAAAFAAALRAVRALLAAG